MCDYSLDFVASRPAMIGDKLISTRFDNSITRGFAAVGEPNVAVCVLPGTEIAFEQEVEYRHALLPNQKVAERLTWNRRLCTTTRWNFPTERSFCSPGCAKASTRPCCSCQLLRAPGTKQSSRSAILSLADQAVCYRACLAVEAIEKSHRGTDGSSTPARGNETTLPGKYLGLMNHSVEDQRD
jgi:hypothetical protein